MKRMLREPRWRAEEGEWMIMVESGEVEMVWWVSCKKKKEEECRLGDWKSAMYRVLLSFCWGWSAISISSYWAPHVPHSAAENPSPSVHTVYISYARVCVWSLSHVHPFLCICVLIPLILSLALEQIMMHFCICLLAFLASRSCN